MAKRVLITGIQGFTGSYVAAEFATKGWEVWGVGQHPDPSRRNYRCACLTDVEALKIALSEAQPSVVIHLAAIAFVGHGDARAFYEVNLLGTHNLLCAVESAGIQLDQIILASSANVYGNATGGRLPEITPFNPANDYAVSKCAMEHMASLWQTRLPILMTRPFNYTGVGQSENFLVPKIVKHFRGRAPAIELGNLEVARDFSDVRDIASMYYCLAQQNIVGLTVNLCSCRTVTLRRILELVAQISEHELEVKVNPKFVRADEVQSLSGCDARLLSAIGSIQRITLEDTLHWMLA